MLWFINEVFFCDERAWVVALRCIAASTIQGNFALAFWGLFHPVPPVCVSVCPLSQLANLHTWYVEYIYILSISQASFFIPYSCGPQCTSGFSRQDGLSLRSMPAMVPDTPVSYGAHTCSNSITVLQYYSITVLQYYSIYELADRLPTGGCGRSTRANRHGMGGLIRDRYGGSSLGSLSPRPPRPR